MAFPVTRKTAALLPVFLGASALGLLTWRLARETPPAAPAAGDLGFVEDFTLVDQNGKRFGRADLNGKVWVANFIFTRCLGPCPLLSRQMSELTKEFPATSGVEFVSISVDPAYDKPAVLKTYAEGWGAESSRWHFLTGEKAKVYGLIRGSFHLAVEENSEASRSPGEEFIHSLYLVLVDKAGHILGYYHGTSASDMKRLRERLSTFRR